MARATFARNIVAWFGGRRSPSIGLTSVLPGVRRVFELDSISKDSSMNWTWRESASYWMPSSVHPRILLSMVICSSSVNDGPIRPLCLIVHLDSSCVFSQSSWLAYPSAVKSSPWTTRRMVRSEW